MKINIPTHGYFFPEKSIYGLVIGYHNCDGELEFLVGRPIQDVYGAPLVYKEFLDREVLELYCDNHGVILLLVDAIKISIGESYRWNSSSMV